MGEIYGAAMVSGGRDLVKVDPDWLIAAIDGIQNCLTGASRPAVDQKWPIFALQPFGACVRAARHVEFGATWDLWPLAADTAKEPTLNTGFSVGNNNSASLLATSRICREHVRFFCAPPGAGLTFLRKGDEPAR